MKTTLIYLRNWVLFIPLTILVSTISNAQFGFFGMIVFCLVFGFGYASFTYGTSYNPLDPRIEK